MASIGGLGRFSRGKPPGSGGEAKTTPDDSNIQVADSNWISFGASDDSTIEFGFQDFNFQEEADQSFGIEEDLSSQPAQPQSSGLRMFKEMPTERCDKIGKDAENHIASIEIDQESAQLFPAGNIVTSCTPKHDSSHSTWVGAGSHITHDSNKDSALKGSMTKQHHHQQHLQGNDSTRQSRKALVPSAGQPDDLCGGDYTATTISVVGPQATLPTHEMSSSGCSNNKRDTRIFSSNASSTTSNWYDAQQAFVTANDSTRVIPVPPSMEKRPHCISTCDKEQTRYLPCRPRETGGPSTTCMSPVKAVDSGPLIRHQSIGPIDIPTPATHSTPTVAGERRAEFYSSIVPTVTPGNEKVNNRTSCRNDPTDGGHQNGHHPNVTPVQANESMDLYSSEKASEHQGFNFEELHAKFLSDIRDLEDFQDGNSMTLLQMQGIFATSYAESLKDQANLLDLLSSLQKASTMGDEMISTFQQTLH